jgi:ubiquinone/menaquinone biosynthesis C-methylase UbiE
MSFPYLDLLLGVLARGHPVLEQSFGRHIHWGYWPDPAAADPGCAEDFAAAAERLSQVLIELAEISGGMRLLDAGCGFAGTIAKLDAETDGLDLVGLNIDPRQLARAAGQVRPRPVNSITFVAGDACTLPFADASFDRVMAVECIFHFPSRLAFLQEVRRVLRPSGVMVLSDFVPALAFAPMGRLLNRRLLRRINVLGNCDTSCTEAGYHRLAAESGLTLTTVTDITGQTRPTYAFLRRLLGQGRGRRLAAGLSTPLIGLLDLFARTGLLRYTLMRFDRP